MLLCIGWQAAKEGTCAGSSEGIGGADRQQGNGSPGCWTALEELREAAGSWKDTQSV